MPRLLRLIRPGIWYHITAQGMERRPIFRDDQDHARKYVETQVRQGRVDSPWQELTDRIFLGGVDFVGRLKEQARCGTQSRAPVGGGKEEG